MTLDPGCQGALDPGVQDAWIQVPRALDPGSSLVTVCSRVQEGSRMGPGRVPGWPRKGPMMGPRMAQDGSRKGPERARIGPERPRTGPEQSPIPPLGPQEPWFTLVQGHLDLSNDYPG